MKQQQFITIDRADHCRELISSYPAIMQPLASIFGKQQVHVQKTTRGTHNLIFQAECNALELGKQFADLMQSGGSRKFQSITRSQAGSWAGRADRWSGMASGDYARELLGETNTLQGNLEEALKDCEKTGVRELLAQEMQGMKRRRKRILSEHDGDWEYDRRYDAACFVGMQKRDRECPAIELVFPVNMLGAASAETIRRFTARCLAVASVLESCGYRVAIVGETWNSGNIEINETDKAAISKAAGIRVVDFGGYSYLYNLERFVIRDAASYGDIRSFSPFSSVEFYRRLVFGMVWGAANYIHGNENSLSLPLGMGGSQEKRPFPCAKGQIAMEMDTVNSIFSMGASGVEVLRSRLDYARHDQEEFQTA